MTSDEKLDKLLEDVAVVRTVSALHTKDLDELKSKLEPVFAHVNLMQDLAKIAGSLVCIGTLVVGVLALFH